MMGRFLLFFGKFFSLLSRPFHRRNKTARRNKHQEFLADVAALNHQIELAEQEKLRDTNRKDHDNKSQRSQKGGEESNYVAMEQETSQESDGIQKQDEEELHFFWELLRFAKNRSWKKKVMTALIVTTSVFVLVDLIFLGNIMKLISNFIEWMTNQPEAAVICFLCFFVAATFLFVPPTILYFGAGYAFCDVAGFWAGLFAATVVCFIGASLGAVLAFLRSRYMMRDLIELFAKRFPLVKCLDRAIQEKGFRVMLMMRLCPILPFNALNYVGGVTKISMEEYTFALVGIIPNMVLWVLVGGSADRLQNREADDKGEYIFLIASTCAGIIFAAVGLYLLYRYGRDELHKEIKEQRALSWHTFANGDDATHQTSTQGDPDEQINEGFEAMETPGGALAVFGIDHHITEPSSIPEDGRDEDWLWIWA
mmetsp:Transcript_4810/g.12034  ORF Transcript_4810/g.12034 Transcript_4810/m.12034 type:complete len:424 (+) Transcript_4810:100-1371(+)